MSNSDRIKSSSTAGAIARKPAATQKKVSPAATDAKATGVNLDKIELTTGAQLLDALGNELEALEDIDQARVEKVKEAIRTGQMPIDHHQWANRVQEFFSQIAQSKESE